MTLPPPLLLTHGTILTMNPDAPRADAIAIDPLSGRILAVGAESDVRAALGIFAAITLVDLHGKTVIPGLIDAHTHLLATAIERIDVDLGGCRDAAEAVERVAARAAETPKGQWIGGRHWNQQFWPGRRFPSRRMLDAAVPDHPVLLWSHSQHVVWVNSLALARAGITSATPEPPGATIGHDVDGELDGILYEFGAIEPVNTTFEIETPITDREVTSLRAVLRELAGRGLTAVHTMESALSLRVMQRLRDAGELPLRVAYFLRVQQLEAARVVGIQAGFGDDWLRIAGIKIFADGALGTHTAAMLQPFDDDPQNHGILTTGPELMAERVGAAARSGLNVAIHAIGDRGVRVALDGIEAALAHASSPRPLRFRIEHVQLAAPEDLLRMARLGVVASVQPFHAVSDRDVADRSWGARAGRAYAYATYARHGIALALGSDVPIETADPWRILHAAIVRRDDHTPDRDRWFPQESLAPERALWAYTAGAAYAGGDEGRMGRLAVGMLGDCVILAEDPLRLPPNDLPILPIQAVIVGGRVMSGSL